MKKRTEITIETERVFTVRMPRRTLLAWCVGCDIETEMMTVDDAAALTGVSSHTIYAWSDSGAVHSRVTPDGVLFICAASLVHLRRSE